MGPWGVLGTGGRALPALAALLLPVCLAECQLPRAPAHGRVMAGAACDPGSADELVTCDGQGVNLAAGQPVTASGGLPSTLDAATDGDETTAVTLRVPVRGSLRPHLTLDLQQERLLSAVTIWHDPCPLAAAVDFDEPATGDAPARVPYAEPPPCPWQHDGICDVSHRFRCLARLVYVRCFLLS